MNTQFMSEENPDPQVLPHKEKYLIVALDSLFSATLTTPTPLPSTIDTFIMAIPALEKAYRNGWRIFFWTWRSKKHYSKIVTLLQSLNLWDMADPTCDDPLLIRWPKPTETKGAATLSLLENRFGPELDIGTSQIVIIESDRDLAIILKSHTKERTWIHLSPQVWFNMVAINSERLDSYLFPEPLLEEGHECTDSWNVGSQR